LSLVLDNSSTMAWTFPEETTSAIDLVFSRVERAGAWVPGLWQIEVANVLQMAVRSKRYTLAFRDRALAALAVLPIDIEQTRLALVWGEIVQLAQRHDLTVYDATYLELAMRRNLPLATLDGDLRAAATREGVPLLGL
jgi:predicted nucleic acid-binding protein